MKKIDLRLRGHHISHFAQYYHAIQNNDSIYEVMNPFNLVMARIDPELMNLREEYTPEFYETVRAKWRSMIENPRLRIKTVQGLDSICRMPCPRLKLKDTRCTQTYPEHEDNSTLSAFDLKQNKVYTSQEIIEKILQYQERTSFASPRMKLQFQEEMAELFKHIDRPWRIN